MKQIIHKILRLFRGKAVCERCKNYAPAGIPENNRGWDGCFMYHWMTFNMETKEEGEYWTPMNVLNQDGRCQMYEKNSTVSHGDNHCIYCAHRDEAFGIDVCNAFDLLAWIHDKYAKCSRKNKHSKCRQYMEKEIRV